MDAWKLSFMTDAAAAARMLIPDDSRPLVIHVAPTAGLDGQLLIGRKMNIAAPARLYTTQIRRQIISMEVAPTTGMHRQIRSSPADKAVRSTTLLDGQTAHGNFSLKVGAPR